MPTATLQRKYEPRSYDLHDLHGISDRTLAMHSNSMKVTSRRRIISRREFINWWRTEKSIRKRCRSTRSSNGDTGSNTTAWSCTNTISITSWPTDRPIRGRTPRSDARPKAASARMKPGKAISSAWGKCGESAGPYVISIPTTAHSPIIGSRCMKPAMWPASPLCWSWMCGNMPLSWITNLRNASRTLRPFFPISTGRPLNIVWSARSRRHPFRRSRDIIPEDGEKVLPARPQRARGRGVRGWYVETLSDARTTLEDFCSILGYNSMMAFTGK